MQTKTLTVPWSHKGCDYLVTVSFVRGTPEISHACPGESLPADGDELEVLDIQADGPGAHIDRDLFVTAQESDRLYETIRGEQQ